MSTRVEENIDRWEKYRFFYFLLILLTQWVNIIDNQPTIDQAFVLNISISALQTPRTKVILNTATSASLLAAGMLQHACM